MATEWYYAKGDQKTGPLSDSELKAIAESGELTSTDLVWKTGATEWVPASRVQGLFPRTKGKRPPPLPQFSGTTHPEMPAVGSDSASNIQKSPKTRTTVLSSIASTARSAAQLAAKQAEKTKLTTITLPSAYRPLGKHCYESQLYCAEFPDLFQQLNAIRKELFLLATSQDMKPMPHTLGDSAKAMARKARHVAQSQTLSMQQASLLSALGKAVYEAHQENNGPSTVAAPITAYLARLAELDANILRLTAEAKGSWMSTNRIAIAGGVAACLLVMTAIGNFTNMMNRSRTKETGDALQNVSATDLYAAFQRAPKEADKRFKGKWLAVTGEIRTRDNSPKSHPGSLLIGLKGAPVKDAYVACFFAREDEQMLRLLDSTPQPPIIGKCLGAVESEYTKPGQSLIEVQLQECSILPLASARPEQARIAEQPTKLTPSAYDNGYSNGYSIGKIHCNQFNRLPDPQRFSGQEKEAYEQLRKDYINTVFRRTEESFDDIYKVKLAYRKHVGEQDFQFCKGQLEGYRNSLREFGFSL